MESWNDSGPAELNELIVAPVPKKMIANRNLIQKIEAIISSHELQEKYSTRLTTNSLNVISRLIKTKPEFFRVVESTLVRNINDNKIRANDVPYIISIISQLYNLLLVLNLETAQEQEPPADTCGTILQFLFSVAIRENLVKVEDETNAALLLMCCDNIIDACIKLLKLKQPKPLAFFGQEQKAPVVKEAPVVKKSSCCGCW
jgi:hypothetical protein